MHRTNIISNPGQVPEEWHKIDTNLYQDAAAMDHYQDLVALWNERASALHARPDQQPVLLSDGEGIGFKEISLYHGSAEDEIDVFRPGEEYTIGKGVYTTSMPDQAFGYAARRSGVRELKHDRESGYEGVAYELTGSDVSFVDLRNDVKALGFMQKFGDYLEVWLANWDVEDAWRKQSYGDLVREKIKMIRANDLGDGHAIRRGNLKEILYQTGDQFTQFVTGLGYDGVIAWEGGEGEFTGSHDSWVLMHPEKFKTTQKVKFQHPHIYDHETARPSFPDFGPVPQPGLWDHSASPIKARPKA